MGYVDTKPQRSISHKLGYSPAEAMERLRKQSLCGLVVSRNQKGWHFCTKPAGHKTACH